MAFSCSLLRITGTDCSFDRLDKSKSLETVSLRNCSKDISNHCSHWSFSLVTTETELILARVGIFREGETKRLDTICPHHRRELGLGWQRNTSKCCVPQSYPNMAQIEKQIDEFLKWYRRTSLRRRGSLFQLDQVSYVSD